MQHSGIRNYRRLSVGGKANRKVRVLLWLLLVTALVAAVVAGVWVARKKSLLFPSQSMSIIGPEQELPMDLAKPAIPPASGAHGGKDPQVAPQAQGSAATPIAREIHVEAFAVATSREEPQGLAVMKPGPSEVLMEETGGEEHALVTAGGHRLLIEAAQQVWVQVRVDDQQPTSFLMQPGEKREWEAKDDVKVVLGNAGGVRMQWDGITLRPLGKSGQVVRLRLPDAKYLEERQHL
jgi:hypothetical protein